MHPSTYVQTHGIAVGNPSSEELPEFRELEAIEDTQARPTSRASYIAMALALVRTHVLIVARYLAVRIVPVFKRGL